MSVREMIENENGIVTIIGLIYFVALIMVFALLCVPLLAPVVYSFNSGDVMTDMLVSSLFFMMVVGMIVSYLIYAGSTR